MVFDRGGLIGQGLRMPCRFGGVMDRNGVVLRESRCLGKSQQYWVREMPTNRPRGGEKVVTPSGELMFSRNQVAFLSCEGLGQ